MPADPEVRKRYTAFHVPRSCGLIDKARRLASLLEEEVAVATLRIPIYAAIVVAVDEALARRRSADEETTED